jgi:hypothetical protein
VRGKRGQQLGQPSRLKLGEASLHRM